MFHFLVAWERGKRKGVGKGKGKGSSLQGKERGQVFS